MMTWWVVNRDNCRTARNAPPPPLCVRAIRVCVAHGWRGVARVGAAESETQLEPGQRKVPAACASLPPRVALLAAACSALTARACRPPCVRTAGLQTEVWSSGTGRCASLHASVGACLTPARAQGLPERHGAADVCDGRAQQQGTASEHRARHVCQSIAPLTATQVLEIAHCPFAEVCWYFPITREQYRLSGARERANLEAMPSHPPSP